MLGFTSSGARFCAILSNPFVLPRSDRERLMQSHVEGEAHMCAPARARVCVCVCVCVRMHAFMLATLRTCCTLLGEMCQVLWVFIRGMQRSARVGAARARALP